MSTYSDYDAIDAAVAGNAASMDAAGCHGALAGMLCINRHLRLEDWLAEIFGEGRPAMDDEDRRLFATLFERTRKDLEAFEFGFDLFLPDEDVALSERTEALSHWCKGFLHGLGSLFEEAACSEDGKEVLRDIYQIADLRSQGVSDEDEDAYMELAEYVRVGVQLVRSEFQAGVSLSASWQSDAPCNPAVLPDCQAPVDAKRLH